MNRKQGSKGKYNADIATQDFYRFYYDNCSKPIPYSIAKDLYKDLMHGLSSLMLEGEEISIPSLGKFSIKAYMPKRFDKDGNFIKPPIDFGRSWEYWRKKYPGKTDEEIVEIKDKPVLRYENRHSKGYQYKFVWDKSDLAIPGKRVYKFKPASMYKRKLAKLIKSNTDVIFESL